MRTRNKRFGVWFWWLRLPGGGPPWFWFWFCCREPRSCLILSEKSGCLIKSSVDWLPEAP